LTIFEFLSVAASIVLALGLSTLITSIPFVFDTRRRDWLHALAFIALVAGHVLAWWRIWPLSSVAKWDILGFAILMGTPLSLYLAATALVTNSPDRVENWRAQFSDRSRWFFSALVSTWVFGILRGYVLLDRSPVWWSILMLGIFVAAASSNRRDVHIVAIFTSILAFSALIYGGFAATTN
jgi:hypothetical protein